VSVNRRHIQLALGVLWLLDGALQLQPFMFGRGFATQVIAPAAIGQAAFVAAPLHWEAGLIASHHVIADAAFATIQLAIGAGLLARPLVRLALAGSIAWGTGVWFLGEGLGGVTGAHTSLLAGAPGAALLYVLLSVAAWPRAEPAGTPGRLLPAPLRGAGGSACPPRRLIVPAWAVLWGGGAVLQSLPGQATAGGLAQTLAGAAAGGPAWLASWDHAAAGWVTGSGAAAVAGLAVLEALIGLLALRRGWLRVLAGCTGASLGLAMWVLGQGMGQIYTGQATDPNAGLLFAIMGVVVASTAFVGRRSEGFAPAQDALAVEQRSRRAA